MAERGTGRRWRRRVSAVVVAALGMTSGLGAVTRVAAQDAALVDGLERDVRALADDEMQGRDNATPGSVMAQDYLIDRLDDFAQGLDSSAAGDEAFKQPFSAGTNILAVIPGTELPDEYVVVGAHYDHLGTSCRGATPDDVICNGATDNAAGVAAALAIGEQLARDGTRRSVILAFWDREEDGLLGSRHYVQNPLVPLSQTVAYINYDIAGANLSPSLRDTTLAVAAESGGTRLIDAVSAATAPGPLRTHQLSSIFGQGRSDYVAFLAVQVPSVFFTDATGPCYHTVADDVDVVDFGKLAHQTMAGLRLTGDLANAGAVPTFTGDNPLAAFDDAVEMHEFAGVLVADLDRFTPEQQQWAHTFNDQVDAIVAAGSENFSDDDVLALLTGAATAVDILATGECDGFLAGDGDPGDNGDDGDPGDDPGGPGTEGPTTTLPAPPSTTTSTIQPGTSPAPVAPPAAPVVAIPTYVG